MWRAEAMPGLLLLPFVLPSTSVLAEKLMFQSTAGWMPLVGRTPRGLGRRRAPVPGGHDAGKATLENGSANLAFLLGIRSDQAFCLERGFRISRFK